MVLIYLVVGLSYDEHRSDRNSQVLHLICLHFFSLCMSEIEFFYIDLQGIEGCVFYWIKNLVAGVYVSQS
jgi:hypothetical protein